MRAPSLSPRLQAIADLFPFCNMAADIGVDHGKLGLYLILNNKCRHILMTDLSSSALIKAQKLFCRFGCEQNAEFLCGDGLSVLKKKMQVVSISGMGGLLMSNILKKGESQLHGASLLLSPHTDIEILRHTLSHDLQYSITDEKIVMDRNRFYIILFAVPGKKVLSEKEELLGPCLIRKEPDDLYRQYIFWRRDVLRKQRNADPLYLKWLEEEYCRADRWKN